MRINYNRLKELNEEALCDDGVSQLSSYYILQVGAEKFIHGEPLTEEHKNLLLEMGILELTEREITSQSIVGPFNFKNNGSTNT
jgi:hypothetical protein